MPNIEPAIAGKHCLVLEDEFLIALDIQQVLESAGAANVTCVGDADAALKFIRSSLKLDFAVLDLKLSGNMRDSIPVASLLSQQGTPFVFLTGMRRDEAAMKKFPQAPVVEKPYNAALLIDAIVQALGQR